MSAPLTIMNQPRLSFKRTVHLTLKGIQYRLFRASVTVAVIAVAIAFLANILCESLIKRSVGTHVRAAITEDLLPQRWVAMLSLPAAEDDILTTLATDMPPDSVRQFRHFSGLSDADVAVLQIDLQPALALHQYYNGLDYSQRKNLTDGRSVMDWISSLMNPVNLTRTRDDIEKHRMPDWPLTVEAFAPLMETWETNREHIQTIADAQRRAVTALTETLQAQDLKVLDAMVEIEGTFGTLVKDAGFLLTDADAALLAQRVTAVKESHDLENTIQVPRIRQALARRFDRLPGDISLDMMWNLIDSKSGAEWYLQLLTPEATIVPDQIARLTDLAEQRKQREALINADRKTVADSGGLLGIGPRMTWLVLVSMLLCTVGIANAMLMSVTERFREIATLKCLGALDGFIMLVFVLEACVLGLVGGLIGSLLGLLLGGLRMIAVFRGLVFASLPGTELLAAITLALFSGIILAAGSALYPSFKAARLAPMEAMRVE